MTTTHEDEDEDTRPEPFPRERRFRRDAKAEPPYEPSSTATALLSTAGYSASVRVRRGRGEFGRKEKRVTVRLSHDLSSYSQTVTSHIDVKDGDPPINQKGIDEMWLSMLEASHRMNLSDPGHLTDEDEE